MIRAEPGPVPATREPASLAELLQYVMDERGYTSLKELSRHTEVPYQTLYAWLRATRNVKRPPAVSVLQQFAADLHLSEALVFRAAGRAFPEPGALDGAELQVLHLYQELDDADRRVAEQMLRSLAERAAGQRRHAPPRPRHQSVTQT
jgi:transcriptional regulator with XRE-family HTH domain